MLGLSGVANSSEPCEGSYRRVSGDCACELAGGAQRWTRERRRVGALQRGRRNGTVGAQALVSDDSCLPRTLW